ncbi:MAG: hypothetical protein N2C14_26695, partial [Planctomycetales bacterium]
RTFGAAPLCSTVFTGLLFTASILAAVLFSGTEAKATKFAEPRRHDVYSRNGKFVLDVNPQTNVHVAHATSDRSKALWSFSKRAGHGPFFLSNDGKTVAIVAWPYVHDKRLPTARCIQFWNASGEFASCQFSEIAPNPAPTSWVGGGPLGDSWRTWYFDIERDGDELTIHTTDLFSLTFSLRDGSMTQRRFCWAAILLKPWLYVLAIGAAISFVGYRLFRRARRGVARQAGT